MSWPIWLAVTSLMLTVLLLRHHPARALRTDDLVDVRPTPGTGPETLPLAGDAVDPRRRLVIAIRRRQRHRRHARAWDSGLGPKTEGNPATALVLNVWPLPPAAPAAHGQEYPWQPLRRCRKTS